MRFTFLAVILAALTFIACDKKDDPTPAKACFNFSPTVEIYPGDEITFTNCSEDADAYVWDFDNGETSIEENPVHTFLEAGTYEVELYAEGEKDDSLTQTVTVTAFPNFVTVDGASYDLSQGIIEYYGQTVEGSYNHDIVLLSQGIQVHTEDGQIVGASGTGEVVYFELFAADADKIADGTYNFTTDYAAGTFDDAGITIDVNFEDGTALAEYAITSGSVEITNIGNTILVEMDLTTIEGYTVTGTFNSEFSFFDYSQLKSNKKPFHKR